MKNLKNLWLSSTILLGLVSSILFSTTANAQSQDRSFIREKIEEVGECRNVAITKTNGDLMLYGQNGWAADGCPEGLIDALDELTEDGEFIDDVQLTEDGAWLILYGDNGFVWNDIPEDLEDALEEFNDDAEIVTSVSFNDDGDWIIISTEHIQTSDEDVTKWITDGIEDFGSVWATCVTDDAVIIVYEEGFLYDGEIPESLEEKLSETDIDVYRLKVSGDAWFFSDGKSKFDYWM